MSRVSRLSAHNLQFVLPDGRTLFEELSFDLANERVGLVGANGAGKSTLLACLRDPAQLRSGRVDIAGTVGWVPQHAADLFVGGARDASNSLESASAHVPAEAHQQTVSHALGIADALATLERVERGSLVAADHDAAARAWHLPAAAAKALSALGLEHLALTRQMPSLSGGEAMRVLLAAQLLQAPDVLLLDEPTNHLDRHARSYVVELVRSWPRALLVATHDRDLLQHVDRILELSALGVRSYGGNFALYEAQRTAEQNAATAALAHAELAATRSAQAVQRTRERQDQRAGSGRARADRRGASAIEKSGARERAGQTASRMAEREQRLSAESAESVQAARERVAAQVPMRIILPSEIGLGARTLVSCEHVRVQHYADAPALFHDLSLTVRANTRLAITGPNGTGKSTLLQLLAGLRAADGGTVRHVMPRERLAYLDQRSMQLVDAPTLVEAVLAAQPTLDRHSARAWLAAFGFRGDLAEKAVRVLSGGERVRLALACAVSPEHPPALLLLDEPGNHLDFEGTRAVEQAVRDFAGAIVVVSHDRSFLDAIAITQELDVRELAGTVGR